MIKNVVSSIGGIEIYGVISICLFVAVFAGAVVWALCQKRSFIQAMSRLPLHDGEKTSATTKGVSHE